MNIKKFMEKYGQKTKIKKGEYLYKHNENDTNLYFILDGEILLTINGVDIALIGKNEINGEKSFINNNPKPIDAKVLKDSTILTLTQEIFNNFEENEKIIFLKQLILFISDRVYLLNEVINNISKIGEKISSKKIKLSKKSIGDIFSSLIKIQNIFIYKKIVGGIIPIYESIINTEFIEKYINEMQNNKITKTNNKYIINTHNYIFILEGEKLKNEYVLNNVFMHTINNLEYLGLLLENEKNNILEGYLEE